MIERIEIHNFQKYEHFVLELDPHVTCICGRSDVGKSSILRALRWLCLNRPVGNSFIRHGAGSVQVDLLVDGHRIVRYRGETNEFRVDGEDSLLAFSKGVPNKIKEILNVSEVNFQLQHSPSFWFFLSPGEVSKELNAIVNLSLIDQTLANVAAELRQAKSEQEVTKQRLHDAIKRRDDLAWTVQASDDLDKLENLGKQAEQKRQEASRLRQMIEGIRKVEEEGRNALAGLPALRKAISLGEQALAARERAESLRRLIDEIESGKEQLCRTKKEIERLRKDLKGKIGKECPLCGQVVRDKDTPQFT